MGPVTDGLYDYRERRFEVNRKSRCYMTAVSAVDFDYVMNLNVRDSFFVAQAVARRLIAAGSPQGPLSKFPPRWAT
ncbi:NAD(P)-dependent dehydrogenase (short-subunit alcohol dehydrogenase family) [Bradyrhizobium sp. USDA 4473]